MNQGLKMLFEIALKEFEPGRFIGVREAVVSNRISLSP